MALYRLGDGKRDKNTINFAASPPTPRKKKPQLAQTQQNTTNIKTVSCGTNVAIFEQQYRVMLTEKSQTDWTYQESSVEP